MSCRELPIVLVGGGGHCRSAIDVIERLALPIRGILEMPHLVGRNILGYPVIGTDDDIAKYVSNSHFLVTLGQIKSPERRIWLHQNILSLGGKLATVISPNAYVSRHASVGEGSIVLNFCNVNVGAQIGRGCILNTMCNIEHDAQVGDYCHISTGAMVNGDARIGCGSFIGSNATVYHGAEVPDFSIIGAMRKVPS